MTLQEPEKAAEPMKTQIAEVNKKRKRSISSELVNEKKNKK
jgi:hypothetical protein